MSELETIHNYYERKVIEEIHSQYGSSNLIDTQLADLACIALNKIPPRYIRNDIDMSFYMTPQEYDKMQDKVSSSVKEAYNIIKSSDKLYK